MPGVRHEDRSPREAARVPSSSEGDALELGLGTGPLDWSPDDSELPRPADAELLRRVPGRRVWREGDLLWKGFCAPSGLKRWRDTLRAKAEERGAEQLLAAGIATPAWVARETRGPWKCVALTWIPGARPLDRDLRRGLGISPEDLANARSLGRALAKLAQLGLEHRDLHPGNWVLDPRGQWWLLDGHAVRKSGPAGARRDLVRLAGEWRERAPGVWRRAVWSAFRKELQALGGDPGPLGDGRALVRDARLDRKTRLYHESDRWLRASEFGHRHPDRSWKRHDIRWEQLQEPRFARFEFPLSTGRRWIRHTGRAFEHGLPVAPPAAWQQRGKLLELYLDLHCPLDPAAAARSPRSHGAWVAAWKDRGFNAPLGEEQPQAAPPAGQHGPKANSPEQRQRGAAPVWEQRPALEGSPVTEVWLPLS